MALNDIIQSIRDGLPRYQWVVVGAKILLQLGIFAAGGGLGAILKVVNLLCAARPARRSSSPTRPSSARNAALMRRACGAPPPTSPLSVSFTQAKGPPTASVAALPGPLP
jgi:hypothetical protein